MYVNAKVDDNVVELWHGKWHTNVLDVLESKRMKNYYYRHIMFTLACVWCVVFTGCLSFTARRGHPSTHTHTLAILSSFLSTLIASHRLSCCLCVSITDFSAFVESHWVCLRHFSYILFHLAFFYCCCCCCCRRVQTKCRDFFFVDLCSSYRSVFTLTTSSCILTTAKSTYARIHSHTIFAFAAWSFDLCVLHSIKYKSPVIIIGSDDVRRKLSSSALRENEINEYVCVCDCVRAYWCRWWWRETYSLHTANSNMAKDWSTHTQTQPHTHTCTA